MKNKALNWFITFTVLFVFVTPVLGQSQPLTADIPFDFTLGTERLSAGKYTIRLVHGTVLQLTSADGRKGRLVSSMAATSPLRDAERGVLVFSRYGSQYFLSKAFWPGVLQGRELFKSSVEAELAKNSRTAKQVDVVTK